MSMPTKHRPKRRRVQEEEPAPPCIPKHINQSPPSPMNDSHEIKHCRVIASYNWIADSNPTIMIPGRPRTVSLESRSISKSTSKSIPRSVNSYIHDPNTTSYPAYPLLPALEALLHTHPSYDTVSIDVVTCSQTIEHLLRLLFEKGSRFRILLQAFGNTVFFLPRQETQDLRPDLKGYRDSFPEWVAPWSQDVSGSRSHHRVLEYEIGGLKCVVSGEGEGYVPEFEKGKGRAVERNPEAEAEAVGEEFTALSGYSEDSEPLLILEGGAAVPRNAVCDIETCSVLNQSQGQNQNEVVDHQKMARMWARQVQNTLVGFHQDGVFSRVEVKNVRDEIMEWQSAQGKRIKKFTELLGEMVDFARMRQGRMFELRNGERGLEMKDVDGVNPLVPDKLAMRIEIEILLDLLE
ncbi:hypothetical protein P170DRAFT_425522 [Aspergillus steynii IBT 23096]|uniref:Geranylgeranyl pyrophosphate synthetase n=1 Tax=Aspergillus steynii IBT 23096 TaxID=1392250 RepID=A0A2I2GEL3_9EURO|nr:uncharacterized protein P170DRAFT_425522 [Aspergillus steynii IBT 23096]PLB51277.1 hypothetical protein P170DRAFT_425522 [Aspergillus steynii IBT 23096]